MKTVIATITIIVSLFGTRLTADDAPKTIVPPAVGSLFGEVDMKLLATEHATEQFQKADMQLAIEQYKKLRMAEFDLRIKLETEEIQAEEHEKLQDTLRHLSGHAEILRINTIRNAGHAASAK